MVNKTLTYINWWVKFRLAPFLRGPDSANRQARNIWHLYQDLIWLGFANAVVTYINVYAIRLGASERLLGLRTSVPSLLMILLRVPAAQLMERTDDRQKLIVRSLAIGRFIYLLIFLLPWLGRLPLLRQIPQAQLLVWLVILIGIPNAFSAAGWDSFFADIVAPRQRARVVSMRSTMTNLMSLTVVPLIGAWLEGAPFPFNYQSIFLLAFIGAMLSTWHVNRIRVPEKETPPDAKVQGSFSVREARRILSGSPAFSALVLATFVYQWAISIASPLYSLYYIEYLGRPRVGSAGA